MLRHVADIASEFKKPTFCLFIAPKFDINTLKVYRESNVWIYEKNGNEIEQEANIIPLSLDNFREFFEKIPKSSPSNPDLIFSILEDSRKNISLTNREWEKFIKNKFLESV